MRSCWESVTARSSMVPTDANVSPRARDCSANRAIGDSRTNVRSAQRMLGKPRIDELAFELGPRLGRHGDRTANPPQLLDETLRNLEGFGLKCAERVHAGARAEELIHLSREDPGVHERRDGLQPEARLPHLGDRAGLPEQGVAPDCRIAGPPLDRARRQIDFRGERRRVPGACWPAAFRRENPAGFPARASGLEPAPGWSTRRTHKRGQGQARGRAHQGCATARVCRPARSVRTGSAVTAAGLLHVGRTSLVRRPAGRDSNCTMSWVLRHLGRASITDSPPETMSIQPLARPTPIVQHRGPETMSSSHSSPRMPNGQPSRVPLRRIRPAGAGEGTRLRSDSGRLRPTVAAETSRVTRRRKQQ